MPTTRRTSLGLCDECIDDYTVDGTCACAVDMKVCSRCGRGPLNDGDPDECGEPDCIDNSNITIKKED